MNNIDVVGKKAEVEYLVARKEKMEEEIGKTRSKIDLIKEAMGPLKNLSLSGIYIKHAPDAYGHLSFHVNDLERSSTYQIGQCKKLKKMIKELEEDIEVEGFVK